MKKPSAREAAVFLALNLAGSGAFAFGVQYFTAPYQIAPGGVAGVATIMNFLWGLPIGVMTFVINLPLLLLSWRHVSRSFTIRTMVSTALLSILTDAVGVLVGLIHPYESVSPLAPLLAALFGGALMGLGNALVYFAHSTTGGTAIIGALLQKRFPQFSLGKLLMAANFMVVILSVYAYGNIDTSLFAALAILTSTIVMDKMVYGLNTNRLLFIISDRSAEIEEGILKKLHRGVTILKGEGGFRHSQKNIIFCVVSKGQFFKVRDLTLALDPGAFIVGCSAGDVLGNGFKHLD
ncbi:MAG: YitT family protein [Provencibacterium sp.]|nr:YitT family protein [Provencibacterium sp.]